MFVMCMVYIKNLMNWPMGQPRILEDVRKRRQGIEKTGKKEEIGDFSFIDP